MRANAECIGRCRNVLTDCIDGEQILRDAQTLSGRLNHRGACSCDNDTGDGAGVLTAIPHALYASILK